MIFYFRQEAMTHTSSPLFLNGHKARCVSFTAGFVMKCALRIGAVSLRVRKQNTVEAGPDIALVLF